MPGETWRGSFQAAVESTYGTPVATATRRLYYTSPDSVLSRAQPPRLHRFATGTRDNQRGITLGPVAAAGSLSLPMSYDEIIELLLMSIQGGVTPSTGTWTFVPGSVAPNSATMQWHDGANVWREAGTYVNRLRLSGAKDGESNIQADLFGADLTSLGGGLAPTNLTQRTPTFLDGWQTSLFNDAFGGTAGATAAPMLLNWDISVDNQMGRKYYNNNSLAASAITIGELAVQAQLTVEAAVAASVTEFTNWLTPTKRLIRVSFLDAGGSVSVDIPGNWTAFDLGQNANGTRTYRLTADYVFDPTNAFGVRFVVANSRTTAW